MLILFRLVLVAGLALTGAAAAQQPPVANGAPPAGVGRLETDTLTSTVFGNTCLLRVWLPPGYDAPENRARRYPVLYLNDGQNLFDSATAVFGGGSWDVGQTASELLRAGRIAPIIVVGIDNAGRGLRGRSHEYLPFPDRFLTPYDSAPAGSRFPDFLAHEVLPAVDARYRTLKGPAHTGLGGSSFGAAIALYTAAVRPALFGRLLLESPALYVDDRHLERVVATRRWTGELVYLGIGTNEEGRARCAASEVNTEAVEDVWRMQELLVAQGLDTRGFESRRRHARVMRMPHGPRACRRRSRSSSRPRTPDRPAKKMPPFREASGPAVVRGYRFPGYSTVTDLARLRG